MPAFPSAKYSFSIQTGAYYCMCALIKNILIIANLSAVYSLDSSSSFFTFNIFRTSFYVQF